MILVVSLNPSIEVNMEVDSLSVGMKHKVLDKRLFMTGKALNVAVGLGRLGADSFATGFMYEDSARVFEQLLHRERVTYKFVWNSGRVRETYKFIDRRSMMTEIEDCASPLDEGNAQALVKLVKELSANCEAVVLSGNLADGLTDDYFGELLSVVPDGVKKVVDAEGDKLFSAIDEGVDLVKPNLEELKRTVKIKITDKDSMFRACDELLKRGAKRVLLSLGKKGAVITDGDKRYFCTSVNVAKNSTAGAGDAMVAAATLALANEQPLSEILRSGVAAGTAAVTLPDTISFVRKKYNEILRGLTVKEI